MKFQLESFLHIADILSESMGNLQESCQVNSQYNSNFASSASHMTRVFCWQFPLHIFIFVSSNCSHLENSVVWRPKPINFEVGSVKIKNQEVQWTCGIRIFSLNFYATLCMLCVTWATKDFWASKFIWGPVHVDRSLVLLASKF